MSFVIANRRCEFLIAPDMNSKNDRYRSHNARCGKPNKKYTPGYRDVAFTDVLYDPEAMDRHGKPLTDENPVRTDRDAKNRDFYIVERIPVNYYEQLMAESLLRRTQLTSPSNVAEFLSSPPVNDYLKSELAMKPCAEDIFNYSVCGTGDSSETSDTLSRNNSLQGGGVHPSTPAAPSMAAPSSTFDEDEEEPYDCETTSPPLTQKWIEDEEENISKIRNYVNTTLGTVQDTLNERSKLTAEARLELSSLRLNVGDTLDRFHGTLSSLTKCNGAEKHGELDEFVQGNHSPGVKRSREEYPIEDLIDEIGIDTLMLSQETMLGDCDTDEGNRKKEGDVEREEQQSAVAVSQLEQRKRRPKKPRTGPIRRSMRNRTIRG